jgi:hypothetical protein
MMAKRLSEKEKRERYAAQFKNLRLKPWQEPPCVMGDEPVRGTEDERRSMELRRRMIDAGIDPWHPDPLAALEATGK